ncbi:MAG: ferrous iron transporter B, partial [Calditrichaeota bacterium]|nr:ferrous iron transporter B [Calditrichota bacterium]
VGPPNTGKTTLFNLLTNGHYKTGNYPGVTVDYHYTQIKTEELQFNLYDSPGIYSLFPVSEDEKIAVSGLYNHPNFRQPDLILSVIDVTQLSRHLYLTGQLIKSGFNVVVVLTMSDLLEKKNKYIDKEILSQELGVPVLQVSAKTAQSKELIFKEIKVTLSKSDKDEIIRIQEPNSQSVIESFNYFNKLAEKSIRHAENQLKKSKDMTKVIDDIVLNPWLGGFIFLIVMSALFTSIFWLAEPFMNLIDNGFANLANSIATALDYSLLGNFLAYGVIGGMGAVLVFLPQIIILFFLIGLLEDSGYLSRAAVIVDLPLTKIGLSGRSFVPLLSGFACAIPAMMSARTIKNKKERLITLFVIPLMSCSARLPVYAILLALIVPSDQPWLGGIALLSLYILHLLIASLVAGIIAKSVKIDQNSQFALELPTYKFPDFRTLYYSVAYKAKAYLKDAGTVILLISIIMWALVTFPLDSANQVESSYLGQSGQLIEPLLEPMGLDWRCGVAIISSFAAREVFVSSLLQVFKVSANEDEESLRKSLLNTMKSAKTPDQNQLFTTPTILGLIVFYMFALMCFPTISVAKKEFGNIKIATLQFTVFTSVAYLFAVLTVQVAQVF